MSSLAARRRLVVVVGVQPGLAQYLKAPGLRWRISYKVIDGDGRRISLFTLTKPLDEGDEPALEPPAAATADDPARVRQNRLQKRARVRY